jgi:4-amino-4-deoxychorismate mutase
MDELSAFRSQLNQLDDEIIRLLGRRFDICRAVAEYKRAKGIPMMQPARVAEVKERCAELAVARNVSPEFSRRLYGLIIDEACRLEDAIIDRKVSSIVRDSR